MDFARVIAIIFDKGTGESLATRNNRKLKSKSLNELVKEIKSPESFPRVIRKGAREEKKRVNMCRCRSFRNDISFYIDTIIASVAFLTISNFLGRKYSLENDRTLVA